MTALYFDLGNTRVKWAAGAEGGVIEYDALDVDLTSLARKYSGCDAVVFASVVKDARRHDFLQSVHARFGSAVHECLVTSAALGVRCGYTDVGRLGIDRWLAVLAGWSRTKAPVLVVDLGTAATLDFVDRSGAHLGGFIVPGLKLGLTALLAGTSNIIVDTDLLFQSNRDPGTSTNEAVYHGSVAAMCAVIETSLIRHQRTEPDAKLLLTGGDAALVARHLGCHYQLQDDLVFAGMKLLHEQKLTKEVPI